MSKYTKEIMASFIDHTLLKPDASKQEILHICEEAKQYHFASVCVNPAWTSLVSEQLKGIRCQNLYCYQFSSWK